MIYKLCFYVPESHLESVKMALFTAGAGRIGEYDHCCWQTLGVGQFRPSSESSPYLGNKGEISQVDEYSVEMICKKECVKAVVKALIDSHPYETPAYALWPILQDLNDL